MSRIITQRYARFQNHEVHQVQEVVAHHDTHGPVVWLLQLAAVPLDVDSAALLFYPLQNSLLLRNVELLEYPGEEEDEAGRSDTDTDPSVKEVNMKLSLGECPCVRVVAPSLPRHSVHVDGEVGTPFRVFDRVRTLQGSERGLNSRSQDEPEALGGRQDGELRSALALVRCSRDVAAERCRDGCEQWENLQRCQKNPRDRLRDPAL